MKHYFTFVFTQDEAKINFAQDKDRVLV